MNLLIKSMSGVYGSNTRKMMEAVLYCLQVAVKDSTKNHRKLLLSGLDVLMDIEERKVPLEDGDRDREGEKGPVREAVQSSIVHNMASMLVGVIGDFNYVVCSHCEKKQGVLGLNCLHCGRLLSLPLVHPTHTKTHTRTRTHKGAITSINTSSDANVASVVSALTVADSHISVTAIISAKSEESSSKRPTRSREKSSEGDSGKGRNRDRDRVSGLGPTNVLSSTSVPTPLSISLSTSIPVPVTSSKGDISVESKYPHHIYVDVLYSSIITPVLACLPACLPE